MITKKTKVVWVTDDNTEHESERNAIYYELCIMYDTAIKSNDTFQHPELSRPAIISPHSLVKLFKIQPLLMETIRKFLWLDSNLNATLENFEETENVTEL